MPCNLLLHRNPAPLILAALLVTPSARSMATSFVALLPARRFAKPHRVAQSPQCRTRMSAAPDVAVVGGGVLALSTALELARNGHHVCVFARDVRESASKAAAGMLAPSCEGLSGDLGDLAAIARRMYPRFVRNLRTLSDVDVGYVSQQDFLVPLLHDEAAPEIPGGAFLDAAMLRDIEPALGPAVRAAVQVTGDAHVDNRAVVDALLAACVRVGVDVRAGRSVDRLQFAVDGRRVDALVLDDGELVSAAHYVAACGAWTPRLLKGVPVRPVKGQMLCLKPMAGREGAPLPLQHVLHGRDVYIVSKENCSKFFVGATVEEAGYCRSPTAGGIQKLLSAAIELVPAFSDYSVEESWAGLRPGTPDGLPILGQTSHENLTIATGTYRNGMLLAPVVAKMTAACATGEVDKLSPELQLLLESFSLSRFMTSSSRVAQLSGKYSGLSPDHVSEQPQATKPSPPQDATNDEGIILWSVLPDGSTEPVKPSAQYLKEKGLQVPLAESNGVTAEAPTRQQNAVAFENVAPSASNATSTTDTVSDAYEDVMQHRDDSERVLRAGMAASRAFGREKSSLEEDGVPLSLSKEEEAIFDAAFNETKEAIAASKRAENVDGKPWTERLSLQRLFSNRN